MLVRAGATSSVRVVVRAGGPLSRRRTQRAGVADERGGLGGR